MPRLAFMLILLLSACGFGSSKPSGSTVTIKLPPPKAAPAPGFSTAVVELGR